MENVEENNKLIAEFMGLRYDKETYRYHDKRINQRYNPVTGNNTFIFHREQLAYHISWDWLMPVVDEIETMEDFRFDMQIQNDRCTIFDMDDINPTHDEPEIIINVMLVGEKIIAVYDAVVEFIKWYDKVEQEDILLGKNEPLGKNNVFIGHEVGNHGDRSSNNIFIGLNAGINVTDESNLLIITVDGVETINKKMTDKEYKLLSKVLTEVNKIFKQEYIKRPIATGNDSVNIGINTDTINPIIF